MKRGRHFRIWKYIKRKIEKWKVIGQDQNWKGPTGRASKGKEGGNLWGLKRNEEDKEQEIVGKSR